MYHKTALRGNGPRNHATQPDDIWLRRSQSQNNHLQGREVRMLQPWVKTCCRAAARATRIGDVFTPGRINLSDCHIHTMRHGMPGNRKRRPAKGSAPPPRSCPRRRRRSIPKRRLRQERLAIGIGDRVPRHRREVRIKGVDQLARVVPPVAADRGSAQAASRERRRPAVPEGDRRQAAVVTELRSRPRLTTRSGRSSPCPSACRGGG